jgi:hypothetical protein
MPVLLVNYQLNNKTKDYATFFNAIKGNCLAWWHFLDNTWIVSSNLTADQYAKKLFPFFEQTDYLLVVKITMEHQGWLPKDAWDWLNKVTY